MYIFSQSVSLHRVGTSRSGVLFILSGIFTNCKSVQDSANCVREATQVKVLAFAMYSVPERTACAKMLNVDNVGNFVYMKSTSGRSNPSLGGGKPGPHKKAVGKQNWRSHCV